MAILLQDTFTGTTGSITTHTGESGVTWTLANPTPDISVTGGVASTSPTESNTANSSTITFPNTDFEFLGTITDVSMVAGDYPTIYLTTSIGGNLYHYGGGVTTDGTDIFAYFEVYLDDVSINFYDESFVIAPAVDGVYNIKIVRSGLDISLYVNDVLAYTYSAPDIPTWTDAYVNFYVNENYTYDNISFQDITVVPPAPLPDPGSPTINTNLLEKTYSQKLLSSGTSGSPGSPAIPGYFTNITTTIYQPSSTPGGSTSDYKMFVDDNGEFQIFYSNTGSGTYYQPSTVTQRVYIPPVPEVPPVAPTPPVVQQNFNLGWNSGANSVDLLLGDGSYSFQLSRSNVGVVTGLSYANTTNEHTEIAFGIYNNGSSYVVMESGVEKTAPQALLYDDIFTVQRVGKTIQYFKNDELIYYSEGTSFGTMVADASLYSGYDVVRNATVSEFVYGRYVTEDGEIVGGAKDGSSTVGTFFLNGAISGSMEPMTGLLSAELDYMAIDGSMEPMTGSLTLRGRIELSGSFEPMTGYIGRSGYIGLSGSLEPLNGYMIEETLAPTYILADGAFQPLTGVMVFQEYVGYTMSGSMEPMAGILTEGEYSGMVGSFAPMTGLILDLPPELGVAILEYGAYELEGEIESLAFEGLDEDITGLLELEAYGSDELVANLPGFELEIEAHFDNVLQVDAALPAFELESTAITGSVGEMEAELPFFTLETDSGAYLDTSFAGFELEAEVLLGATAQMDVSIFDFELEAAGPAVLLELDTDLPFFESDSLEFELEASLFGFELEAFGRQAEAVDATQYVGYCVNLEPVSSGRGEIVNQTTTFTNYAYKQIVKLKGKYYGINGSGIFELDGQTDDGSAINWSFRTHLSDLGTRNIKTLRYAYIRGRVGANYDMVVQESENTDDIYLVPQIGPAIPGNSRAKLGRGVRAEYFAVGLKGNGPLQLDALDIDYDISSRGVK